MVDLRTWLIHIRILFLFLADKFEILPDVHKTASLPSKDEDLIFGLLNTACKARKTKVDVLHPFDFELDPFPSLFLLILMDCVFLDGIY